MPLLMGTGAKGGGKGGKGTSGGIGVELDEGGGGAVTDTAASVHTGLA